MVLMGRRNKKNKQKQQKYQPKQSRKYGKQKRKLYYGDKLVVTPKTVGQRNYVKAIEKNTITFCSGPAGTGKTLIAASKAVEYIIDGTYKEIVIVRPAVVACKEKIGFLPGNVDEKMGPFTLPVAHCIGKLLNRSDYDRIIKYQVRILPMAYMRGLTLENCVIILDEAQNTKPEQMKMFLTRIGEHCKVIVEGDEDQTDISYLNGLTDAIDRLYDLDNIGIVEMDESDILRSDLTAQILRRYQD